MGLCPPFSALAPGTDVRRRHRVDEVFLLLSRSIRPVSLALEASCSFCFWSASGRCGPAEHVLFKASDPACGSAITRACGLPSFFAEATALKLITSLPYAARKTSAGLSQLSPRLRSHRHRTGSSSPMPLRASSLGLLSELSAYSRICCLSALFMHLSVVLCVSSC